MRLLADSHVLLWWLDNPALLTKPARDALRAPANDVYFSAASVWELGLKRAKGKLRLDDSFVALLLADGFTPLAVTVEHAAAAIRLPALHGDPFDRMLVAQAQAEGLVLVTRDDAIAGYGCALLRC